jgi:hypothetical protein
MRELNKEHSDDILTVSVSIESESESQDKDKSLSPNHQTQLWSLMFETLKDILYKEYSSHMALFKKPARGRL